jgi:hypothetical protein
MDLGGRQYRYRSPLALTGIVACAVMLGCGRWGAQLGLPPLYLGELLLAVAVADLVVAYMFAGSRPRTGVARRGQPGLAVAAFLAWAMLRFAVGAEHGLDALRDAAPYGYALVAFLAAGAYARSSAGDRRRTIQLLEVALVWHLLWVVAAQLLNDTTPQPNMGEGLALFVHRGEDGGVLGITACLFLLRYLRRGGLLRLLVVAVSLASMLAMTSRGALLATLVALALTFWCHLLTADGGRPARRVAMVAAVPIMLLAFAVALPNTSAGSRLLVSVGSQQPQGPQEVGALGTKQAREEAWDRVIAYTGETLTRELVGVGFGPPFMIDSGASVALLNGDDPMVRSPHNYLVGTYARLGLIGIGLLGLIGLQLVAAIWRVRRLAGTDDLVFLAMIVPPVLAVEATVGVILEAPFGAIPFFWFLGILLAKPLTPVQESTEAETETELIGVS